MSSLKKKIKRLYDSVGPLGILLIALVIIFLPTGDPSDALITFPLIAILGLWQYIIIALIIAVIAIAYFGKKIFRYFKIKKATKRAKGTTIFILGPPQKKPYGKLAVSIWVVWCLFYVMYTVYTLGTMSFDEFKANWWYMQSISIMFIVVVGYSLFNPKVKQEVSKILTMDLSRVVYCMLIWGVFLFISYFGLYTLNGYTFKLTSFDDIFRTAILVVPAETALFILLAPTIIEKIIEVPLGGYLAQVYFGLMHIAAYSNQASGMSLVMLVIFAMMMGMIWYTIYIYGEKYWLAGLGAVMAWHFTHNVMSMSVQPAASLFGIVVNPIPILDVFGGTSYAAAFIFVGIGLIGFALYKYVNFLNERYKKALPPKFR